MARAILEHAEQTRDRAEAVKRLSIAALCLVLGSLIFEALGLNPAELERFRDPLPVAFRLALLNALPYLLLATSLSILVVLMKKTSWTRDTSGFRFSLPLAVLAVCLAITAAFASRSSPVQLLGNGIHLYDDRLVIGDGGPLAPSLPLQPVALEQAGVLLEQQVAERAAPWTATVRWIGMRTAHQDLGETRIELLAGSTSTDVTADFMSLRPGEARVFSRNVRLGPQPARVRLRLAQDPLPPVSFFSNDFTSDIHGMAIDTGGGDRAYRVAIAAGPQTRGDEFAIDGEHTNSGFAVVVLSGDEWRRHDLSQLIARSGKLQMRFGKIMAPAWTVRLVGDGVQSEALPLDVFEHTEQQGEATYTVDLDRFVLGKVPASAVVGIALGYSGAPGPFTLRLSSIRALLPEMPTTGLAVATTAALDPGARPAYAWFTVGDDTQGGAWRSHLFGLRVVAGLLTIVAVVGVTASWSLIAANPVAVVFALLVGPLLSMGLPRGIHLFIEPRVEQGPMALVLLVASLLFVALAGRALRVGSDGSEQIPPPRGTQLDGIDALKGLGILGVIMIHVTADAAGMPYTEFPPSDRIPPAVLRALATGFNYPVFLIVSLFLLAHALERRGRSYPETLRERLGRLMPPFLLWSLVFVAFRFVKASAFGYSAAYRHELSSIASWLNYLLLGGAQYHLHFLPLLLGLVMFYPLFRPARRQPAWALLLLVTLLLWPLADRLVYEHVASPDWRNYALRLTKTCAYLGYGYMAFALYGLWRDRRLDAWRIPLLGGASLVGLAALAVLVHAGFDVAAAGSWLPNTLLVHMARYLAPASLFVLLLYCSALRWPRWLLRLGTLSFGVYILHPILLDLLEIMERGAGLLPLWTVAMNFTIVAALSAGVVALVSRVGLPGWVLGVEKRT